METKTSTSAHVPKDAKPKKKKNPERLMAYSLIAPSLILILVIAIWPVLQSFYFSMFDLKLSDPSKSETHLGYEIDLSRYLDNYPFLISGIDNEIKENPQAELTAIKEDLESLDKQLQDNPDVKANYDIVNDKLLNFEKVDEGTAVVKIDKKLAQEISSKASEAETTLKKLELKDEKKITGLADGLKDVIRQPNFIGFKHYSDQLTDARMWKALSNTLVFTLVSVGFELVIGLAIALLINKAFFGRGLIRATILIPWAIPTAVSALMWKFLYDGQNGVIAKMFEEVGIVNKMAYLLTTDTGAMFSVIFTDVWKTTPYMALLLLAGLQTIPGSLYEAASIDGATKWKQFTSITLPLLKSSLLVALLFRTLDAFRVFDLIFVLTGGGPANSTETISLLAYKYMFNQQNFGTGSALSVIVFICVAIISMIFIRFLGRDLLNDGPGK
ncbi:sugar ABC transporter permease [Bacillus sp. FJAT-42376]|uniref:carbohydrate ABC transporter permease n=1 Tax=Bacillus sp. FJAT-42376 TaxID=2014076 RepID=UPI000F4E5619|nr:sugar ABC transporter permease [Bacillus sp. FJAT-42376]AZB44479.1 sugar ABC transporter permease [Bacillus sp. FJAT-42376]